jgi:hypothetical protein
MELNPNHPVTQQVSDHWHKICALLMAKLGTDHVVITLADIARMEPNSAITIQELHDGLHLRIVNPEQADEIARREGGLPS